MKKTILTMILLVLTWSAAGISFLELDNGDGSGSWVGMAFVLDECGSDSVCAEWLQSGSPNNGTICCIDQFDLSSKSFSACQKVVSDRPPDNDGIV